MANPANKKQADFSCWPLALWFLGVKIPTYRNQFQDGDILQSPRVIFGVFQGYALEGWIDRRNLGHTWDASKPKLRKIVR